MELSDEIQVVLGDALENLAVVHRGVAVRAGSPGESMRDDEFEVLSSLGLPRSRHSGLDPALDDLSLDFYQRWTDLGSAHGGRLMLMRETGVILLSDESGDRPRSFVNSSVRKLAEISWRAHALGPIIDRLRRAGVGEEFDVLDAFWRVATKIDPQIDLDPAISLWQSRIVAS
jgi:hypothetical protein